MILYAIGNSGQSLILTENVINHFAKNQQKRFWQKEAGGQLFAEIDDISKIIRITQATGPRPSDRRTHISYTPNPHIEQNEINQYIKHGLHFVGDWHTHPENNPKPSNADERSIRSSVRESKHDLNGFILIIVGRLELPRSLYVAMHDGHMFHNLNLIKS